MYLYCANKIVCSTIVRFRKSNPSLEKPLMTFFIDAAVNPIFKLRISKLLAFLFGPAIHAIGIYTTCKLLFLLPSPSQGEGPGERVLGWLMRRQAIYNQPSTPLPKSLPQGGRDLCRYLCIPGWDEEHFENTLKTLWRQKPCLIST